MPKTTPRDLRAIAATLMAAVLLMHVAPTLAASVVVDLAEGGQVTGELVRIDEGRLAVRRADDAAEAVDAAVTELAVADIAAIQFGQDNASTHAGTKPAENWMIGTTPIPNMPQSMTRNVRLQAGYHRLLLLAGNNGAVPRIDLRVNGGGMALRPIPADWLAHAPEGVVLSAPMADDTGMRLAITVPAAKPMMTYRTFEPPDRQWSDLRELLVADPTSTGFTETIESAVGDLAADTVAGIVFDGLIKVPQDDTYTFSLQATGPAALMIDSTIQIATVNRWTLLLRDGSQITGGIRNWTRKQIDLELLPERVANIPLGEVSAIWPSPADGLAMPTELAGDDHAIGQDVVAVTNEGSTLLLKGIIKGRDDNTLLFNYDGNDRRIAMDKLQGARIASSQKPLPTPTHRLTLHNGSTLNATVIAADANSLTLKPHFGGELHIPLMNVASVAVLNGRRVYLSDIEPAAVEEAPYFSRVMHYRRDTALDGKPLRLMPKGKTLERGLAVHSFCALTYDLDGDFTKFHTTVGFQHPTGRLGRASLRIEGDGKTLWRNDDMRGSDAPIDVDLNVAKVKQLTLIADFGQEQDVGDRIIWGNAHVIRGEAKR